MLRAWTDFVLNAGAKGFTFFAKPYDALRNNQHLRRENIESFLEYKSISEYLNYASCEEREDNHVYKLKDGRYGIVLRLLLPSFASDAVEDQLRAFLKTVNEEIDIVTFNTFASQNLDSQLNRFLEEHPCEVDIEQRGFLKKLIHRRYKFLRDATRGSLYDKIDFRIRNYVSIVSIIFNESLNDDDCFMRIEAIKGTLGNFAAASVPPETFVALQREFFHGDKDAMFWNDSTDTYTSLDKQITRGGLRVDVRDERHEKGFVVNDEMMVSVLTTKKFPGTIDFTDTDSLFMDRLGLVSQPHIRGPYYTSLVLDYRNSKEVKKDVMSKAQANFNETVKISNKDLKKNPKMKKRKEEAEQIIRLVDDGTDRPVRGQWTLVLWDDDKKRLTQSVSSIQNSFSHKGWELIEETFGHVALFSAIHALPLQLNVVIDEFLKRKPILFEASHHCPIVPLLGESSGMSTNTHIPWFSRTGQLQWFDPFDSDTSYNIACSGDSGSGKSYTVNDLITISLGQNYVVRIIDSLASYKKVANALGGQYEEFTNGGFCMNFFTNIMLKEDDETGDTLFYIGEDGNTYEHISDEDYAVIIPMIGAMIGINLSSSKSELSTTSDSMTEAYLASVFEEAIRVSFEARGREAGMKEVYQYVVKKYEEEKQLGNEEQASHLRQSSKALARFGDEKGPYFRNFNGANNIDIYSDFSVFELQALEGKGILYTLGLMAVSNKIATEFFNLEYRTRRKILAIDEFWKYIDMPIVLSFANELARKIRKAGGLFMPITQGIADYFVNDKMRAIYENCAWQFVLKNKPVSISQAIQSNKLSVTGYAASLLKGINPKSGMYGEFAIMEGASLQFSRLRTDGVSHYLFTSSASDEAKIRHASETHGITYEEAILFLGIKRDEAEWDDERILIEIGAVSEDQIQNSKELDEQRNEDIETGLKKTLELSNYYIEDRFIYNKDNEVEMNILRFGVKSLKHDIFYFDDYAEKMLELGLDSELTIQMFDKAMLPEYEEHKKTLILVAPDTLFDNKLYQYAKELYKPNLYKRFGFVIDVSKGRKELDRDELRSSLKNWRDLGFEINIKRYSYLVDNELVLDIEPNITIVDTAFFDGSEQQLENTIGFAKVFSEDVALIDSENLTHFALENYGVGLKDSKFSLDSGIEIEEIEQIERLESVNESL